MHNRDAPYNTIPVLPPAGIGSEPSLVPILIEARVALAELKMAGKIIPNESVLINSIILQEAKLSSEIENIVTTNDELYRALADQESSKVQPSLFSTPQTKEVLRYREAMQHGYRHISGRPICTSLMEEMASIVRGREVKVRSMPGTKIANPITYETIYTPPEGEQVIRDLLQNLEEYLYDDEDKTDVLIKMSVSHYQFEAIHPFSDGNGRTGRILNVLYLVEKKILNLPTLYLSRYIIEHKGNYYKGLREVTGNGDWLQWLVYMVTATYQTAVGTKNKIISIHELMNESADIVKTKAPSIYSLDLINAIFAQPYSKIKTIENAMGRNRQTAAKYLSVLVDIGVLDEMRINREKYFINQKFMDLLAK